MVSTEATTSASKRARTVGIRRGGAQFERIHSAIAKAALVELAQNGLDGLEICTVARRAKVSERTVYRHYETKSDLAIAAIQQIPRFTGWADGDDKCAQRLRRGLEIGAAHRDYFAAVLATAISNRSQEPSLLRTLADDVMADRYEQIALFVQIGQERGEIRPAVTARMVAALIDGLLIAHYSGQLRLGSQQRRSKVLFDVIWPAIATDEHLND